MENRYDIIVCGGGISGAMAAVSAGRLGARVLLVEAQGYLGGMLTAGGVGPMMTFHAGDVQVVRGITGELIDRLKAGGYSPGHIFDTTGYTYTVTPFDAEGLKAELDAMAGEAGVDVLFNSRLAGVTAEEGKITGITVCNKAGLTSLNGGIFIDATGDADLAFRGGIPCDKGREEDGLCQPMTMNLRLYNVDIREIRQYFRDSDDRRLREEFPRLEAKRDREILEKGCRLSFPGFTKSLKEARERGEISFEREDLLFFETNNPGEVIVNTSRITGLDPTDPADLSRAEAMGRRQAKEIFSLLRKHIPGFGKAVLGSTGPVIGVRSSRQIRGMYRLTEEDISRGTRFDDAVMCYGYPIDVHGPTGNDSKHFFLEEGAFYTVPYRCLISGKIRNLITVGRCISSTFEAQASYRTTPGAGAIGHAGGVAAWLASRNGNDALGIDRDALKRLLREQGAYLP